MIFFKKNNYVRNNSSNILVEDSPRDTMGKRKTFKYNNCIHTNKTIFSDLLDFYLFACSILI